MSVSACKDSTGCVIVADAIFKCACGVVKLFLYPYVQTVHKSRICRLCLLSVSRESRKALLLFRFMSVYLFPDKLLHCFRNLN